MVFYDNSRTFLRFDAYRLASDYFFSSRMFAGEKMKKRKWYQDSLIYDLLTSDPDKMTAQGRDGQAIGCALIAVFGLLLLMTILDILSGGGVKDTMFPKEPPYIPPRGIPYT